MRRVPANNARPRRTMREHVKPATPLQGFTCDIRFYPSLQAIQHEAGAWEENYGLVQKMDALHLQPELKKPHAHLRGAAQGLHVSMYSGAHWAAWTWQFAWR